MVYAVGSKSIYPTYIKPLFTYDERIAEQQEVLDTLLATKDRVEQGRLTYKSLVQRTGSFDMAAVENAIRQRLYTLIELHNLKDWTVSPGRKSEDRKTQVKSMLLTVQAKGPVQGVAGLLRDLAEFPYLVRFGSVSISPVKSTLSGGRMSLFEHVSFRLPIEIKVPPQHRTAGRIDPEALGEPEPVVRHQGRDYAALWSGRPFSDFMEPQPLKADAGQDQNLGKPGRTIALRGSATGGIGDYTFQWSPSEAFDNPTRPASKVDTSEFGEFEYTLTVTDEGGNSDSDTVLVKIVEPYQAIAKTSPPPPAPRGPKEPDRWGDRRFMQLVMSLGNTYNGERRDELMVFERKSKQTSYYAAGDEFDGGKLVYVHQTGGLVRRQDAYFVYPIGLTLDDDLLLDKAGDFPELIRAAEYHRKLTDAEKESKAPGETTKVPGGTEPVTQAPAPALAKPTMTANRPAPNTPPNVPPVKRAARPQGGLPLGGIRKDERATPGQNNRTSGRKPQ